MADPNQSSIPTVICDDVHIVYRVNAGGGGRGSATAALSRILGRGVQVLRRAHGVDVRQHVGVLLAAGPREGPRPL
ncbi:hypothetical protein ABZ054_34290, partial [Streptomyces sp. NPDC006324]